MVNRKRRNILTAICIIVILALTAGFWIREKGKSVPENYHSEQTNEKSKADNSERSEQANASKKKEYTEEEKARIEEQTGVTVQNDGTVEVNIGEILEEEESAAVSREEAEKKILKEAGKGYEIERLGLEKYQDNMYWAARVVKGGEARQIWIDAEAGETFLNQKE